MQLSFRFGLYCSLASLLCSCGGTLATKPILTPPTVAAAPLQPAAPAPDLSPVAAPKGVIAFGRLSRPGDLTKTLAGWVSLPFEPKMIDALQPGLALALAFDAPAEFAVVLPEGGGSVGNVKPELVMSVGLASVEQSRRLFEDYFGQKLVERGPSLFVTPEESKYHCAIAAALGKANSRFVCADKPASLEHLLPYATRGLPLENLGASDLHVELRFEALRQEFGAALRMGRTVAVPTLLKELSLSDARFDRPLSDVAHAFADELLDLFEDADKIVLDAAALGKPDQVDLKLTIAYRGATSFVSQATLDTRQRMQAPNAQFFDLPADAEGAGYVTVADPKRLDKPRALVGALAEGLLAHFEVGASLRRDVRAALDTLFAGPSPMVYADGPVATPGDKTSLTEAERGSLVVGWRIYGLEGNSAPYKEVIKTLARLSTDRAFRKGLDNLAVRDETGDGKTKPGKVAAKTGKPQAEWLKLKSIPVAGMPMGSEVLSLEFDQEATQALLAKAKHQVRHGGKKPESIKAPGMRALFAVVPDGSRTWFVLAMDEKTLVDRAKVVLASSKAPRLSTRSDLQHLRGQNAYQAGFSTLQLGKGWLQAAMAEQKRSLKEADNLYSTLPHHGNTPMFYRGVVVGGDKQPVVEFTTSVPRAVFEDVAAAVPTLMMLSSD